jgi:DNA-binding HxlR family transcriptional regulator
MSGTRYAQFCALARAAEIIGERWTLLIVRELMLGPMRFTDLGERLSGISPSLLTARLNGLVECGIVRRATLPAAFGAQVYELTGTGRAMRPAILELIRWGGRFLFPVRPDDAFEPDWALLALDAVARREPTPACRIGLRLVHQGKSASFLVEGGPAGTQIGKGDVSGGVVVETGFDTLLRILARDLSVDAAAATRRARITGPLRTARRLPDLFDLGNRRAPSPAD